MTFRITVQPSGRQFDAESAETILAAGIRQGIGLPYGCKDGACGSCKCKLVSGTVTHGPHQEKALNAEEEAAGSAWRRPSGAGSATPSTPTWTTSGTT